MQSPSNSKKNEYYRNYYARQREDPSFRAQLNERKKSNAAERDLIRTIAAQDPTLGAILTAQRQARLSSERSERLANRNNAKVHGTAQQNSVRSQRITQQAIVAIGNNSNNNESLTAILQAQRVANQSRERSERFAYQGNTNVHGSAQQSNIRSLDMTLQAIVATTGFRGNNGSIGQYCDGDGDRQPELPCRLPPGWEERWDNNYGTHYYDRLTGRGQYQFSRIRATKHVRSQGFKRGLLHESDVKDIVIHGSRSPTKQGHGRCIAKQEMDNCVVHGPSATEAVTVFTLGPEDPTKFGVILDDPADTPSYHEGRIQTAKEFWDQQKEIKRLKIDQAQLQTAIELLIQERDESRMKEEELRNERDALQREVDQLRTRLVADESRKHQRAEDDKADEE